MNPVTKISFGSVLLLAVLGFAAMLSAFTKPLPTENAARTLQAEDGTHHFKSGEKIPFKLVLKSDFAKASKNKRTSITLDQDVWVQKAGDGVFISFDGKTFEPFSEAFTGQISAKVYKLSDSDIPQIKIVFDVDRSKEK